ncbi:hypothetical protein EFM55_15310 [Lactiplantibacillus pentosus]|nr:hypothetical protein [Lactiplantibacillus pentosus]
MKFHHLALPRMPSSRDGIRKADICGPQLFVELVVGSLVRGSFDIQQSDWILTIAKLLYHVSDSRTSDFTELVKIFSGRLR